MKRHVKDAIGKRTKANVLIFKLECGDGESAEAHELALFLADLNDGTPNDPGGDVCLRHAAGTQHGHLPGPGLRQDRHALRSARLGDFEYYCRSTDAGKRHPRNLADVAEHDALPRGAGPGNGRSQPPHRRVASTRGDSERRFLSEKEFKEDNQKSEKENKGPRWQSLELVKPAREEDADKYLTLDAATAQRPRAWPRPSPTRSMASIPWSAFRPATWPQP